MSKNQRHMKIRTALCFIVALLQPAQSWATCGAPVGSIGQIQWITPNLRYCDGTNWVTLTSSPSVSVCVTPGVIRYNTGALQVCGSTLFWNNFTISAAIGTCTKLGAFQFNSSRKWVEYCDATGWRPIASAGCVHALLTYTTAQSTSFVVPASCTSMVVKAWGAGGGAGAGNTGVVSGAGGSGGYASGIVPITPAATINIIVGGGGNGASTYICPHLFLSGYVIGQSFRKYYRRY